MWAQTGGKKDDCEDSSLSNWKDTQKTFGDEGVKERREIIPGDIYLRINHIKC